MKKVTTVILSILLMLFCTFTVSAAENNIDDNEWSDSGSVFAKLQLPDGGYSAIMKDGYASIITDEGIKITITGNIPDSFVFSVVPILDEDALSWFGNCMKGYGIKVIPYDIYIIDKDGKKYQLEESVKISLTIPSTYKNPVIFHVSKDGKVKSINSYVEDTTISFYIEHMSYYVLAEKTMISNDSDNSYRPNAPQTGDTKKVEIWITYILVSSGMIFTLYSYNRRKMKKSKK